MENYLTNTNGSAIIIDKKSTTGSAIEKGEMMMKKHREYKAKKIMGKFEGNVRQFFESHISLYAKAIAENNQERANTWQSRIAGALDMMNELKMISINEMLLLNEYAICQAHEKADEIKNGAA